MRLFIINKKPQVNEKKRDVNRTIFRHFGNVIVNRGLISINTQSKLSEALDPSFYPFNKFLPSCEISWSKQEVDQKKHTVVLKDITRLLELVTIQEEKYGKRQSPHGNFHC